MSLGSIDKHKQESFLLSSTHGAEMSSLGAASKTELLKDGKEIKKYGLMA